MKWLNRSDFIFLLYRYSHYLAEHPYTVLFSIVTVFVTIISLPFITHKFPDFSDPQLGFEARGTDISLRLTAWDNLVEATRTSGPFTLNPSELYSHEDEFYKLHFFDGKGNRSRNKVKLKGWKKKKGKVSQIILNERDVDSTLISATNISLPVIGGSVNIDEDDEDFDDPSIDEESSHHQKHSQEDFFCGDPSPDYSRMVLSSTLGKNLFTHGSLLSMCRLEHEILIGNAVSSDVNVKYRSLCQPSKYGECCRSWSIPNYVALLRNHSSCMSISEEDVEYVVEMVYQCAPAFSKSGVVRDCVKSSPSKNCYSFPEKCWESNWAFNIFHFLADKDFLKSATGGGERDIPFLHHAMIFLPVACSTATLPYYSAIKNFLPMEIDGIRVDAVELGLRDSLFDQHLIQDSWLLFGVTVAIGACMWLYSRSYLIAVAAIISIPLSLGLSYTAYKYIFRLAFFPFLNMVAAVISLGIGVDDAFIFCKIWKFMKKRAALSCAITNINSCNMEQQNQLLSLGKNTKKPNDDVVEEPNDIKIIEEYEPVLTVSHVPSQSVATDCISMNEISNDCDDKNISESSPVSQENLQLEGPLPNLNDEHRDDQQRDTSFFPNVLPVYGSEEWLIFETLKRSFQSMFVTSFTTAAAFYFSYFSQVTAIRCFSIFAGTAVITNFLLMLTWFPAAVVIAERWASNKTCVRNREISLSNSCGDTVNANEVPHASVLKSLQLFFNKCLITVKNYDTGVTITKHWALIWVLSLGLIALTSVVIASYMPGLHPSNELQFQLLHSSHLFERYHLLLRSLFRFEQDMTPETPYHSKDFALPLRFVFGILPLDQGDPLDPVSRVPRGQNVSNIHLARDFDMSSRQGQAWLLKFCQSLRSQPFYGSNSGPLLSNCFIETFKKWMSRRCFDPIESIDRTPCCETSHFPFSRKVFQKCLLRALAQVYKTPHLIFFRRGESAGPRFLKTKPHQMVAMVVEYESRFPFTTSFNAMDQFYNSVEIWMTEQMKSAPKGMKSGWFVSNLYFYDLQRTLSTGVLSGVCISLGVSALTLLVFTCNFLKSALTAISIASATSVTLATLSLLGWSLGPVESLTLSLAVGLSADFALHFAICHQQKTVKKCQCYVNCWPTQNLVSILSKRIGKFKLCGRCQSSEKIKNNGNVCSGGVYNLNDENDSTESEVPYVGVPATFAALTTALAGALMLPSSVVAYTQVGVFLIVLMATSWFYSTFFLISLLKLFHLS